MAQILKGMCSDHCHLSYWLCAHVDKKWYLWLHISHGFFRATLSKYCYEISTANIYDSKNAAFVYFFIYMGLSSQPVPMVVAHHCKYLLRQCSFTGDANYYQMMHVSHLTDMMLICIIHNLLVAPGAKVDVLIVNGDSKEIVVADCCEMGLPSCTINAYRLHRTRISCLTEEQSSSCSGKYGKLVKNLSESDQHVM